MNELEQVSRLIERIYDAALDASLWPDVLQHACYFVQGCTANLFFQDIVTQKVVVFHSWGEDPHYRQLYFEKYAPLNPLFPASSFLEVGTVHAVNDIMPLDEFRTSRLYQEWVQPQGILDVLYSNLERTATGAAALAIRRLERDGLFDDSAKARFALLVPHVRRAVSIGKVIDFHRTNEVALSAALDRLTAAVLLVTSDARPVYLNAKAQAMLVAGDVLCAPNGRIAAVEQPSNTELREALAAAARGDASLGVNGISISLTGGAAPHVAHVLSLRSGVRREVLDGRAATAVFVYQTTLSTPQPLEIVTRMYGLTGGEVRVLAALAESSGVAQIATALGISAPTVKTHLQRLFAKTGTRSQAELLKLLAAHASPVRV